MKKNLNWKNEEGFTLIELVGEPESSSCLAFISIPKDNLSLDA